MALRPFIQTIERCDMQRFTFQVVDRDLAVLNERTHELPDAAAIWEHVLKLTPIIRSRDRASAFLRRGGVVAALGVASAQKFLQTA
jgi:hypothetical protein